MSNQNRSKQEKQAWYVTVEYNDDNEPYRAFRSLGEVRKNLFARRLTRVTDNYYTYKSDSRRTLVILNTQGLIEYHGSEEKALAELQYYGVEDAVEHDKHYESLGDAWYFFELRKDRHADRSMVEAAEANKDSIKVLDYDSICIGDYWGRMCDRFKEALAPKKPATMEELRKVLPR
jgi:hypothetical protein